MIVLAAPALPLHTAGKYVAGAYIVFVALILVYVAILGARARKTERELTALRQELRDRERAQQDHDDESAQEPVIS